MAQPKIQSNQLTNTGVTPGSYTTANITVDATGRITAAATGIAGAIYTAGNLINTTLFAADVIAVRDIGVSPVGGNNNIFIGPGAGTNFTTGTGNVVIGALAGDTATQGSNNVLIGIEAGHGITTGINNILIGYQAGRQQVINGDGSLSDQFIINNENVRDPALHPAYLRGRILGTNSTLQLAGSFFIKDDDDVIHFGLLNTGEFELNQDAGNAGEVLTSGGPGAPAFWTSASVGIVYTAGNLIDPTLFETNVIAVRDVGVSPTGGNNNILIGPNAGAVFTGGTGNVVIGALAGSTATQGSNNVIIGIEAGLNIVDGQNNILLGYQAGRQQAINGLGLLSDSFIVNNENVRDPALHPPYLRGRILGTNSTLQLAGSFFIKNDSDAIKLGFLHTGEIELNGSPGTAGQVLTSGGPGASPTWAAAGGGGTPGGLDTQVQFNDGGVFGGDSKFIWNKASGGTLTLGSPAVGVAATIRTPDGDTGAGLDLSIYAGNGIPGNPGGTVAIQSGGSSTGGTAGTLSLRTPNIVSGNGAPGPITITSGSAGTSGTTANVTGGRIDIIAGAGGATNGNGGNVTIRGGALIGTGGQGNVLLGGILNTVLPTTAKGGFVYIPAINGAPTGIPVNTLASHVPMVFDSVNNRLYVRDVTNTTWVNLSAVPAVIQVAASDETTALTAGVAKVTFRLPHAMTLTSVRASLTTAQTSGTIFTVDIKENGTSIMATTKITIDNTEKTSTTAVALPVLTDITLADDAEITVDIIQVGDGTAKGLKVTLIGTR